GYVSKVTVHFDITHTYDPDLVITLMSPSGSMVTLVYKRDAAGGANFTNTTLDDAAATSVASAAAPFNGTFRPEQSLGVLGGEAAQGTWTLRVQDISFGDQGQLKDWSLTITTTDQPPPPPSPDVHRVQSTDVPKAIQDNATVGSTLQVPDLGTITNMTVRVSMIHTFDSDLRVNLIGPGGASTRLLINRRGGAGINFTSTTLDDASSVAVASGTAPFAGTYKPEEALSAFNGLSAAGTWTLTVQDMESGDVGQITAWSVTFT